MRKGIEPEKNLVEDGRAVFKNRLHGILSRRCEPPASEFQMALKELEPGLKDDGTRRQLQDAEVEARIPD